MQETEAIRNECREDTIASHRRAVERVITSARERLCEPISLRDMSRVAYLSEFHFNRVFHQITGLPPAKFISAMRLDEAKRLLLNTDRASPTSLSRWATTVSALSRGVSRNASDLDHVSSGILLNGSRRVGRVALRALRGADRACDAPFGGRFRRLAQS
jgi:AraC-like DNA-binding protein